MQVTLLNNNSKRNSLNKSLTTVNTINIATLINDEDLTNVSIVLSSNYNFNYVHIPQLNRYYFVEKVVKETETSTRYILHCDVLQSFKSSIMNLNVLLDRQEQIGNYYINDSKTTASYQNSQTLKFTGGNISEFGNLTTNDVNTVLVTVGSGGA